MSIDYELSPREVILHCLNTLHCVITVSIYLHVSDDYWDAQPVGVPHQPPHKLRVLRPSLWSLHDRLANVVPHTGGMYSLLENKVSHSV